MSFCVGPFLITTDRDFYQKVLDLIHELTGRGSIKSPQEAENLQIFSELIRRKVWGDRQE